MATLHQCHRRTLNLKLYKTYKLSNYKFKASAFSLLVWQKAFPLRFHLPHHPPHLTFQTLHSLWLKGWKNNEMSIPNIEYIFIINCKYIIRNQKLLYMYCCNNRTVFIGHKIGRFITHQLNVTHWQSQVRIQISGVVWQEQSTQTPLGLSEWKHTWKQT